MADEPTVEVEAAPEPVVEPTESVDTPEPVSDTIAEALTSDTLPEADSGEPVEPLGESSEPAELAPVTIEALSAMAPGERIKLLRESVPELAQDLEYAGAERREAELKREAGSREQTAERLAAIKARLLANPDADVSDLNFLDENNQANVSIRNLSEMAEKWATSFEPSAEERELLSKAAMSDNRSAYAALTLTLAAKSVGSKVVYEGSVADIPADSALAKSILADKQAYHLAEVEAARLEAKEPREPAPRSANGRPAGSTETHDTNTVIGVTRAVRAGQMSETDGQRRIHEINNGVLSSTRT